MGRTVRFGVGWLAAATAAVGLSWAVIRDAAEPGWLGGPGSPTRSVPAASPAGVGSAASRAGPSVSTPAGQEATLRPSASPAPSTSGTPATSATPATSGSSAGSATGASPAAPGPAMSTSLSAAASAAPTGAVRSYLVTGGRVVLQLAPAGARLVSATPDTGYRMQSWEGIGWLRVDFSLDDTTRSSVFASWNGTAPSVRTVEY